MSLHPKYTECLETPFNILRGDPPTDITDYARNFLFRNSLIYTHKDFKEK